MSLPIEELTPRQIVAELDRYIVGQNNAKKAVAVALRNRYRRQQLPAEERDDIMPKNILMIGPTGVGKTEIARRLAQLARAPFVKVEATKFTEVGYVGRDVESMVRDLVANAVRLVEKEKTDAIREEAQRRAIERIAEIIERETPSEDTAEEETPGDNESLPEVVQLDAFGMPIFQEQAWQGYDYEAEEKKRLGRVAIIIDEIATGQHDDHEIDVEVEEAQNPFLQVFTPGGMEEMGIDMSQPGGPFGSKRSIRVMKVRDAKTFMVEIEAGKMVDKGGVHREAIERAEQTGIIFIDEIDKVAIKTSGSGPDVSREGVQRDLLPIIEGSTVASKFGPVRTDHILFVAAGAFHMAKPSDLIPELQGRLPIRVELDPLSEDDFRRILLEPKNALTMEYTKLLSVEGVTVAFTTDALEEIAKIATEVNQKTENIGARRLHTIMEKLLEEVLYEAPEVEIKNYLFNGEMVRERLGPLVKNIAVSRTVL